jgi:hypothetical protein
MEKKNKCSRISCKYNDINNICSVTPICKESKKGVIIGCSMFVSTNRSAIRSKALAVFSDLKD